MQVKSVRLNGFSDLLTFDLQQRYSEYIYALTYSVSHDISKSKYANYFSLHVGVPAFSHYHIGYPGHT